MKTPEIVIDTNVLVSALKSKRGASFKLLQLLGSGLFEIDISVPLVLEYETVSRRLVRSGGRSEKDIDAILDYICAVGRHRNIHYLWRPFLRHPKDEMILELGVAASCDFVVTYNKRDFAGIGQFGIEALTPREFLERIGVLK